MAAEELSVAVSMGMLGATDIAFTDVCGAVETLMDYLLDAFDVLDYDVRKVFDGFLLG